MGAELNFQNRGKPGRRFLVCNRRKNGADGHFSGDTSDGFAYNSKEHKKREEKGEAAANSSAKSSRIIGKIYKPRRMVAAVLAAAMFLFAFPLNSLAQTIKDTNAA